MTNKADEQYLELCRHILANGVEKDDRTGTGTLSTFGWQMRFDLSEGFPLLTTKKLPFRVIAEELRWFLSGSTDLKDLLEVGVNIWNADAYRDMNEKYPDREESYQDFVELAGEFGYELGPIYGHNWRSWGAPSNRQPTPKLREGIKATYLGVANGKETAAVDQIAQVIESIRTNPDSRRHIVSAWNVGELDAMALPPCHTMFQFYVANGKLSCQLYQRSADVFLGLPFNIASYALLTHMIAKICDLEVGEFIHTLGDAHIYSDHISQVREQLRRKPKHLPNIYINKHDAKDPAEYTFENIELIGYAPHPPIKAPLSVGLKEE